jgi:hypothetical protein
LKQLRRAQGVQPVMNPAELRGPGMPEKEFQALFEAATSGKVQPTPDHSDLNALLAPHLGPRPPRRLAASIRTRRR